MRRQSFGKKMNNKGSSMILVLTILSLIAILGTAAMSTALLNIKMRGMNRASDKNFYELEIALDEIYAQTGRMSGEILKTEYADVLASLYQNDMETNEKANQRLRLQFMRAMAERMSLSQTAGDEEANCEGAAEKLKSFAATFAEDPEKAGGFTVSVDSVSFTRGDLQGDGMDSSDSGLVFGGLCLTYVNSETEVESALTVDLKIDVPYVRFINDGGALLDYCLVANRDITVNTAGTESLITESIFTGNLYGGGIMIDKARVTVNSSLMAAAGNLTVRQRGGALNIGPDTEAGGISRVWVDGIELDSGAELYSNDTSFYVRDDMTLINNDNQVKLNGSYYGYGNEGISGGIKENKDRSSAILLNDRNSTVDLRGLDSLILAGRANLRFHSDGKKSPSIYPMGESLAVRATQFMYLIPEEYITVDMGGQEAETAPMNPIIFPEGEERITITVSIPEGVAGVRAGTGIYTLTSAQAGKSTDGAGDGTDDADAGVINSDEAETPAFLVAVDGKIYVYYRFSDDGERSEYFESYLTTQADSFDSMLKKGGTAGGTDREETKAPGEGSSGGIYVNDNGRVVSSGSLYRVTGEDGAEHVFELLQTRQGEMNSSLKWVTYGNRMKEAFENIQKNLAETMRVPGDRAAADGGDKNQLPVRNYIRLNTLGKPYWKAEGDCAVLLAGDAKTDLKIDIQNGTTTVTANYGGKGITTDMPGGLIVSGGDITITGDVEFDGLIIAAGSIRINGNVILTAAPERFEPLLDNEEVAQFFYDYSDSSDGVLNRYEDFVTLEGWSRSGRERGGDR